MNLKIKYNWMLRSLVNKLNNSFNFLFVEMKSRLQESEDIRATDKSKENKNKEFKTTFNFVSRILTDKKH